MQGVERADRELLDAQALVGHLVAEGSMFAFLAAHRQDLFADEEFEDLFPSGKGRPSIPASVMASILMLQTLHDLSDRETAEAARCDLRWKVATGMALDDKGFDPSTLVYWRKRLAKSTGRTGSTRRCARWSRRPGSCVAARKRAVDSTILADAVATQDTITQLVSAIRRVGRIVPGGGRGDRGGVHRARLQPPGQAGDRLGRARRQGRAGLGPGQRRERAAGGARRDR